LTQSRRLSVRECLDMLRVPHCEEEVYSWQVLLTASIFCVACFSELRTADNDLINMTIRCCDIYIVILMTFFIFN